MVFARIAAATMLLLKLNKIIMNNPVNFVVDMDISKFFDTVDHKKLMECLKQRIVDPSLLRLIGRFLKSGIMEEGKYFETEIWYSTRWHT